jgi:hypothetical protein
MLVIYVVARSLLDWGDQVEESIETSRRASVLSVLIEPVQEGSRPGSHGPRTASVSEVVT